MSVSPNGAMVAYGLAASGSDWQEYRVRDVESGKDREDLLKWIKFSGVAWTKDNKGFFYSRYAEPKEGEALTGQNFDQKLYYHRVGAPQAEDVLIYERPDHPKWGFQGTVTDDGKYLIIEVWEGSAEKNAVFVKELKGKEATTAGGVVEVLKDFDAKYDFIDNSGATLWMFTDKDAPRGKVVAIDTEEAGGERVDGADPRGGRDAAIGVERRRAAAGELPEGRGEPGQDLRREGEGARRGGAARDRLVGGLGGKKSDNETFFSFTSYTTPGTIYRYDVKKNASELFKAPTVLFNPDDYATEQVFYPSKDGTKVPMFLVAQARGWRRTGRTRRTCTATAASTPRSRRPSRWRPDVDGDGRGAGGREPARRRRVRRGVARGGDQAEQAERVR
jgi:prolyl oligopeptidase